MDKSPWLDELTGGRWTVNQDTRCLGHRCCEETLSREFQGGRNSMDREGFTDKVKN